MWQQDASLFVLAGGLRKPVLARRPFLGRQIAASPRVALRKPEQRVQRSASPPAQRSDVRIRTHASFAAPKDLDVARVAIVGAGFAGLSVCYNLILESALRGNPVQVSVFDPAGIGSGVGGGGSQVAGGLLHGYTPRGKPMWMREEALSEAGRLLRAAREAAGPEEGARIARQGGIVRPAFSPRQEKDFRKAGRCALARARGAAARERAARAQAAGSFEDAEGPLPGALFIRSGGTVDSRRYLAALWAASAAAAPGRLSLGAVGAGAPGGPRLPLDVVKGHVVEFEGEGEGGALVPGRAEPVSVISGKYLGFQASGRVDCGATFEPEFSGVEPEFNEHVAGLLEELQGFYPDSAAWIERTPRPTLRAGLRAVPHRLVESGSTPVAGPLGRGAARCWLLAGLGSRGLFHAGWLGRRVADAVLDTLAEGGGEEAARASPRTPTPVPAVRAAEGGAGAAGGRAAAAGAHAGRP
eukprot:tig00021319_g20208.t1